MSRLKSFGLRRVEAQVDKDAAAALDVEAIRQARGGLLYSRRGTCHPRQVVAAGAMELQGLRLARHGFPDVYHEEYIGTCIALDAEVVGSSPTLATHPPGVRSGHMGNTLALKGFSTLVMVPDW